MDSQIQYKIVLDVVQAETGATNLNQDLTTTKQKVDQVNSTNLNKLSTSFDKAAKSAKTMSQEVSKTSQVNLQLGDTMTNTFQNALSSLDGVSPGIKEMANQVNGAIPIVKSLKSTVLSGLKGIRGAMASTGIGTMVVAVGMLAANWDKSTGFVKKFIEHSKPLQTVVNWVKDLASTIGGALKSALEGIVNLGKTVTKTVLQIAFLIKNTLGAAWDQAVSNIKNFLSGNWKDISNLKLNFRDVWKEAGDQADEALGKVVDKAKEVVGSVKGTLEDMRRDEQKAREKELLDEYRTKEQKEKDLHQEKLANIKKEYEERKISEEAYHKLVEAENKRYQDSLKSGRPSVTTTKSAEEIKEQAKLAKDFQTLTQALQKPLIPLDQMSEKAKEAYQSLYNLWQLGEDTKDQNAFISAEEALEKVNTLIQEGIIKTDDWAGIVKSLVNGEVVENQQAEKRLKNYTTLANNLKSVTDSKYSQLVLDEEIAKTEKNILQNQISTTQKQIDLLNKYNDSGVFTEDIFKLENELDNLNNQMFVLVDTQATKLQQGVQDLFKTLTPEDAATELKKSMADLDAIVDFYLEKGLISAEEAEKLKTAITEKYTEKRKAQIKQEAKDFVSDYQAAFEATQQAMDTILSIGDGLSSKWGDAFAIIHQGFNQIALDIKSGVDNWQVWSEGAQSALGFASQLLQAYADEQDTNTEEGFNKQKKLQKASVLLSGLQGSVAAMSNAIRDLGYPAGPITGGIMSAMILALTAKQIQAINKTSLNNVGSTSTGLSATPILSGVNESLPTSTVVTNQDDQRVYILQSDLTKSSKQVQVRESNSTF